MKFGRFEQQGRIFFGSVEGEEVTELDGSPFKSYRTTGKRYALSALKLLVPFTPVNFYCAGLNYAAHVEWGNKRKGTTTKLPEKDGDVVEICNDQIGVLRNPVVQLRIRPHPALSREERGVLLPSPTGRRNEDEGKTNAGAKG
ncbi:MAG TPA: DUF2437 domain-containing protein [Burkholderiales bacterium]|nr:DUF2437 domain-containing protein [Burkholderiales bacterium]